MNQCAHLPNEDEMPDVSENGSKRCARIGEFGARAFIALIIVLGGFGFFGQFRTMDWMLKEDAWLMDSAKIVCGFSLASCLLMAPFSWLPFVGLNWRYIIVGMVGIALATSLVCEVHGRGQELWLVHQHGTAPNEDLSIPRWFPFSHHHIFYHRGHGWMGTD